MSRCTLIVFNGTSSPDASSACWFTVTDPLMRRTRSPDCESVLSNLRNRVLLLFMPDTSPSVARLENLLSNCDRTMEKSGRKVGRQAEIIPLPHSTTHQVQAFASVHDMSVASNSKRVRNRYMLVNTTLRGFSLASHILRCPIKLG